MKAIIGEVRLKLNRKKPVVHSRIGQQRPCSGFTWRLSSAQSVRGGEPIIDCPASGRVSSAGAQHRRQRHRSKVDIGLARSPSLQQAGGREDPNTAKIFSQQRQQPARRRRYLHHRQS